MTEVNYIITKYELGCIRRVQVHLENRPAVTITYESEGLTEQQLVQRAIAYWEGHDKREAAEKQLRDKYDRQVYAGNLPCHDIETNLNGYYAYVLKDRRSKGKYQILEAIELDR
ncbi:hypothetical protein MUP46_00785 [Patescibacteria group bacterium]|nr:hypothetical protein [Patescibacteria group bacterium]